MWRRWRSDGAGTAWHRVSLRLSAGVRGTVQYSVFTCTVSFIGPSQRHCLHAGGTAHSRSTASEVWGGCLAQSMSSSTSVFPLCLKRYSCTCSHPYALSNSMICPRPDLNLSADQAVHCGVASTTTPLQYSCLNGQCCTVRKPLHTCPDPSHGWGVRSVWF